MVIGFGDSVEPIKESLELFQYNGRPIFEGSISLQVYPVETIFAEKLQTIISKGSANSRMKDFHDLLLLSREGILNPEKLKNDIIQTFKNRATILQTQIDFNQEGILLLQNIWGGHVSGLGKVASDYEIPNSIKAVINEINNYLEENLKTTF